MFARAGTTAPKLTASERPMGRMNDLGQNSAVLLDVSRNAFDPEHDHRRKS
jgi:hypothetical protein